MNRTQAAASNVAMDARDTGIVLGIPIERKSLTEVLQKLFRRSIEASKPVARV